MFSFKEPPSSRPNNYRLSEIALKSGFKFRDIENRKLDWKALGCVDVNKVIENQDYEFLEKITPKIIEAPMQSILGTAAIDPAVSSLFRLAQMSLQYMSFCQQFMSHTLYDLRTAFNHIQKKYSSLKHNYKCLEEQHYKAQERIQSLLKEMSGQQDAKPSSLYPCDKCTKNFSSLDSLKSHHQRKHTVIGEKHELSDDNEKDDRIEEKEKPPKEDSNQKDSSVQSVNDNFEKEVPQSHNNNNNDNEPNANCTVCSQKTKSKTDSSSIAIQCEVSPISNENIETQSVQEKGEDATMEKIAVDNENHGKEGDLLNQEKNSDTEQIQNAYETISELKKEIVSLKNSLEAKIESEHPTTAVNLNNSASFVQTNDKIDVIEQKFNAFEVMYMESQHQFIESFRNLDERQKTYLDNIQETIKEIVEKSIGQHDSGKNDAKIMDIENKSVIQVNTKEKSTVEEANGLNNQNDAVALPKTEGETIQKRFEMERSAVGYDTSSYSEDDGREVTCEAEVHTISQSERHGSDQEDRKESKKNTKSNKKSITKDVAIHEFEHRLRQFGVDIDSAGLATPRSCEINQDLANERKEMRKAHRSFEKTRKQLRNEVDRMAKGKLASANSATSQSSYQSDQILDDSDEEGHRKVKNRPKSASVQRMRKRNAKKLMNKFVENDIDENDIIDKMQMAQAAISSHRQCIQQLLETTAHSPSSLTKIKYSSSIAPKEDAKTNNDADNTEPAINQYNKMPNVTTRRVVFVNLDEDS